MLGGILVNVVVGILIFVILAYKNGNTYTAAKDVKYGIVAYDLAKSIGLRTGDKIVKVNGKPIKDFAEVRSSEVFLGENSSYTVERNGQLVDIDIPNDFLDKLVDKKNAGQFVEAAEPFSVLKVADPVQPGLLAKLKGFFTGITPAPVILPAYTAGIKAGDRITAVNGKPIRFYHEFQELILASAGKKVTLGIQRGNQALTLTSGVTPEGKIGIMAKQLLPLSHEDYTFGQAIAVGSKRAFSVVYDNIKGFGKIFSGNVSASKALSGPIGIAQNLFGGVWIWDRFWTVTGLLSMALAFMNALPIPALDGGHATILGYEIISGRKPTDRFLEGAQRVGMVLLLGLMAFAIFNDVFKAVF